MKMKIQVKFIIFIAIVVILVGGFGVYSFLKPVPPSKLDGFAQCLKSSGAEFYGAFWCSHCKEQKDLFGSSFKYLPYIECANKDNSQKQVCIDKKIEGYPTWVFKDGTRESGKMELTTLAQKTQCLLPE
ncbi:MAG: thioredoxin domain-containing protein [Candidatus Paceibacterota bacterium]